MIDVADDNELLDAPLRDFILSRRCLHQDSRNTLAPLAEAASKGPLARERLSIRFMSIVTAWSLRENRMKERPESRKRASVKFAAAIPVATAAASSAAFTRAPTVLRPHVSGDAAAAGAAKLITFHGFCGRVRSLDSVGIWRRRSRCLAAG